METVEKMFLDFMGIRGQNMPPFVVKFGKLCFMSGFARHGVALSELADAINKYGPEDQAFKAVLKQYTGLMDECGDIAIKVVIEALIEDVKANKA